MTNPDDEIQVLKRRLEVLEARLTRLETCFNFVLTLIREGKIAAMPRLIEDMFSERPPSRH